MMPRLHLGLASSSSGTEGEVEVQSMDSRQTCKVVGKKPAAPMNVHKGSAIVATGR